MIWGLLPIILFTMHYNTANIGIITISYGLGIGQLFTGKMSDIYSKENAFFLGNVSTRYCHCAIPFVVFLSISISFRTFRFWNGFGLSTF
jgi:hypothetical protein